MPARKHSLRYLALRPVMAVALFGFLWSGFSNPLKASPITLRFEAQIASVFPINGGISLPFTVAAGDFIVTTFTFEPGTDALDYPQTGDIRFVLANHEIHVPSYTISIRDEDAPNATDLTGRVADPGNTPIVDLGPGSSDVISISCDSDSSCGSLVGYPQYQIQPAIHFSTDYDALANTDLTAEVDVWNQFSFREMSLTFSNSFDANAQTYIGAYIGHVSQVPEPSAASSLLFGMAFLMHATLLRLRRCP